MAFAQLQKSVIDRLAVAVAAFGLMLSSAHAADWKASWKADPAGFTGVIVPGTQTLREIISPRRAGTVVRVKFSNREGILPVTFSQVWLGKQLEGAALVAGSNQQLLFAGLPDVTVAAGEEVMSDPLVFAVQPFEKLAVSMQSSFFPPLSTSHPVSRETNYFSLLGAAAGDAGSAFLPFTLTGGVTFQASWHYIAGLDVESSDPSLRTIVAFGDSIFDGLTVNPLAENTFVENIATLGTDERYVDFLQKRLDAAAPGKFAIVNASIAGNSLTLAPLAPFFGTAGLQRIDTDVIGVPGVTDVIMHLGINDIAFSIPTQTVMTTGIGDSLIAGLEESIAKLQAAGIRVILGTVMPAVGANGGAPTPLAAAAGLNIGLLHGSDISETVRQNVNAWIRSTGAEMADGIIDFAACMHAPDDVTRLNPEFNSGDNLHPNPAGFEAMANCTDIAKNFSVSPASGGGSGGGGLPVTPSVPGLTGESTGGSLGLWILAGFIPVLARRIRRARAAG